jgi:hypothetical protein
VEDVDRDVILAAQPSPTDAPEVWWLLERAYHGVGSNVGNMQASVLMPSLPTSLGATGRCFWIFVYLVAVEDIRRWHQAQHISDEVSWETLADLGRHIRLARRRSGSTGLDTPWWITLHFQGALYALGRLQFQPYHLKTGMAGPLFWYDAPAADSLGAGFRQGDPALGLHIPESRPLTPAACDASLQQAREFFKRHFPEFADAVCTCTSWVLDDQLLDYLEPDSNIVRFQRRFELVPGSLDSDASAFHFVFGRPLEAMGEITPHTRLEQAIIRHVKEGRHWRLRTGWLRLPISDP